MTFKVGRKLKQEAINTLKPVVQTKNKVCQKIGWKCVCPTSSDEENVFLLWGH